MTVVVLVLDSGPSTSSTGSVPNDGFAPRRAVASCVTAAASVASMPLAGVPATGARRSARRNQSRMPALINPRTASVMTIGQSRGPCSLNARATITATSR